MRGLRLMSATGHLVFDVASRRSLLKDVGGAVGRHIGSKTKAPTSAVERIRRAKVVCGNGSWCRKKGDRSVKCPMIVKATVGPIAGVKDQRLIKLEMAVGQELWNWLIEPKHNISVTMIEP